MSLDNVTAVNLVSSNAAVVGSLGSRETILGPSEGVLILIQKGVLLFNAKPRVLVLGPGHDFVTGLTAIGLGRKLIVLVSFAQDQLVVAKTEGVLVKGHGVQVDIRVATLSLTG